MMAVSGDLLALPALECLLMGSLSGLVGALAIAGKRIFLTESLTHATFPGAVLGVVFSVFIGAWVGQDRVSYDVMTFALVIGAVVACVPMIGVMRWLASTSGVSSQAAAGSILAFSFSVGYFFNVWFAPLPLHVDSFLVGSVMNVDRADVFITACTLFISLGVYLFVYRFVVAALFDPVGYRAAGMNPVYVDGFVMLVILLTIAALVPAVGTILPIALVAAPAASLWRAVSSFNLLVLCSALLGAFICLFGLIVAVYAELSAGGVIAVVCGLVYALSVLVRQWRRRS